MKPTKTPENTAIDIRMVLGLLNMQKEGDMGNDITVIGRRIDGFAIKIFDFRKGCWTRCVSDLTK